MSEKLRELIEREASYPYGDGNEGMLARALAAMLDPVCKCGHVWTSHDEFNRCPLCKGKAMADWRCVSFRYDHDTTVEQAEEAAKGERS